MLEGDALAFFLEARCGKLTASNMARAISFKKDGTPSSERLLLQKEILAERLTGHSIRRHVNPAMEFGLAYEDEAKSAYEAHTGNLLVPAGVCDHPSIEWLAATPDAFLDSGLCEIKVPTSPTFIEWLLAGKVPEQHKPQMLCQMACTGRKWCEFVSYDPRIRNPRKRLFIRRFEPTAEEIANIEAAASAFLDDVEAMFRAFTEAAA